MFKWLDKLEEAIPGKAATENVQHKFITTAEALLAERGTVETEEEAAREVIEEQEEDNRSILYPSWSEFVVTAWEACVEPYKRREVEAEYEGMLQRFSGLLALGKEYLDARQEILETEARGRAEMTEAEAASTAHAAYALFCVEREEDGIRHDISEQHDDKLQRMLHGLATALHYEEQKQMNNLKERKALVAEEEEDREAMYAAEDSNWESLLFEERARRENAAWMKVADEFLAMVLAELDSTRQGCLMELAALHQRQTNECALLSEEVVRHVNISLEEEAWDSIMRDELANRKATLRAGIEKEEQQRIMLENTVLNEEKERGRLCIEEESEAQEILSLKNILLSALRTELEAKKSQMVKTHARERREFEERELSTREAVLIEEANVRCGYEDEEYVGRSEAMIEERTRVAEEQRVMKMFFDSESRDRETIREEAEAACTAVHEDAFNLMSAYQSWIHSLMKEQHDFLDREHAERSAINNTSYYAYGLIYCELTEGALRESIDTSFDMDSTYFKACTKLEACGRSEITKEQVEGCKTLKVHSLKMQSLMIVESLRLTVKEEGERRVRLSEEEEIFRGSLVYRVKHEAIEIANRIPVLSMPAVSQTPSPKVVVHTAPPNTVTAMFDDEEFALERLMKRMEQSASVEVRFYEGEHAQVLGDEQVVCSKCKFATCGWTDDKANYLGKAGLVCQTNLDCALLYFADGRQHWFPQSTLTRPSQAALQEAPKALPENPAMKISRSICRTYLNAVLPGGDDADALTIAIYVGIPVLLFLSILGMMYYRTRSGV